MDTIESNDIFKVTISCKHFFCVDCWKEYLKEKIKEIKNIEDKTKEIKNIEDKTKEIKNIEDKTKEIKNIEDRYINNIS